MVIRVLSLIFLLQAVAFAGEFEKLIEVRIRVHVPNHLNTIDALYIAGSHVNLGSWKPNAVRLSRVTKNMWEITARLPEARTVEFKFTLGDWQHGEITNLNRERPNRFVYCTEDCQMNLEIENFRLTPFHPKPSTASGRIEYFHEFYFQNQDNFRSVAVYLPPNYDESRGKYPVLYALDGQNLFDNATASFGQEWKLDEVADQLISRGEIPPVIIVGIYSTEKRSEELLMNSAYADFITYGVKPFIEKRYRAKKGRAGVLGSSFGGVFAFFAAWKFSNHFEKFAALSTAYWWGNLAVENLVSSSSPIGRPIRLWMDMGTKEGGQFDKSVEQMMRVYSKIENNFPGELAMRVIDGGTHNEKAWGARVGDALKFLYAN